MSDSSNWEEFFDQHAPHYLDNIFTKNTAAELDFLVDVLDLKPGTRILDVGCGVGRHTVGLAQRGCRVTGVDLSAGMLEQAQQAADEAGVEVELIKADATQYRPETTFDAVICLCEGGFNLLSLDADPIEHDLAILRNIHAALPPDGLFLLTTLLGFRHLKALFTGEIDRTQFDPIRMVEIGTMTWETDDGQTHSIPTRERSYTPSELRILLHCAGFDVLELWGGTAGDWGKRPIKLFEYEMMALCRRRA